MKIKREYHVEMPLTGFASGTVIAESEEEAIELFYEQSTSDDIDWGLDQSNATVTEGIEVECDDDDETETI